MESFFIFRIAIGSTETRSEVVKEIVVDEVAMLETLKPWNLGPLGFARRCLLRSLHCLHILRTNHNTNRIIPLVLLTFILNRAFLHAFCSPLLQKLFWTLHHECQATTWTTITVIHIFAQLLHRNTKVKHKPLRTKQYQESLSLISKWTRQHKSHRHHWTKSWIPASIGIIPTSSWRHHTSILPLLPCLP